MLLDGIVGLGGVISKPYRGALKHGPRGFAKGLVQGALCVLRPPIGVLDLLTALEAEYGFLYLPISPHISPSLVPRSRRRVHAPQLAPEGARTPLYSPAFRRIHCTLLRCLHAVLRVRCTTVPHPRPEVGVFCF